MSTDQILYAIYSDINRRLGASINYVKKQGGGEFSKWQLYFINFSSELVNDGGEGGQNLGNSVCQHSLWMPHFCEIRIFVNIVGKFIAIAAT